MKKTALLVALGLLFGAHVAAAHPAQSPRQSVINLVRAINTAENAYKLKHGSFADWSDLSTSDEFKVALARFQKRDAGLTAIQPEMTENVLPGWTLRLIISTDRKSYDVLISDGTGEECGFAFQSDERGLIRQAIGVGCPEKS